MFRRRSYSSALSTESTQSSEERKKAALTFCFRPLGRSNLGGEMQDIEMPEQDVVAVAQVELTDDSSFDLEAIAANYEGKSDLTPAPPLLR